MIKNLNVFVNIIKVMRNSKKNSDKRLDFFPLHRNYKHIICIASPLPLPFKNNYYFHKLKINYIDETL